MTAAIEDGLPKRRIEAAAARKQARIDQGIEKIIGVNEFQVPIDDQIDVLAIDNDAVRQAQVARIQSVKASRNDAAVQEALEKLKSCAENGQGNLLAFAVQAARSRATLGEISMAMETVFGRYQAKTQVIQGVYSSAMQQKNEDLQKARALSDRFAELDGRRPRMMVAKLGQDGHDRGAKVIATSFADMGFDVDVGPLFQTPEEAVKQAIENDVHILGISSLAAGHRTLVPQVVDALKAKGRADILVITGGVIPPQDYALLYDAGVAGIFGPGTVITEAAIQILNLMVKAYEA